MTNIQSYEPFSFISPYRIRAISLGIQSHNRDFRSISLERQHLYEHMNSWHRALNIRTFLVAHVVDALSDDENAILRNVNNMIGIQFDGTHFARLFKIHELIDTDCIDKMSTFPEPKAYTKARSKPSQLFLFPPDVEEPRVILPLSHLHLINIGYYVRQNKVVELYFIDQDQQCVRAIHPLGLLNVVPRHLINIHTKPKPTVQLKNSNKREDAQ